MHRRVFIPRDKIDNDSIIFDSYSSKHIFSVLRLKKGDQFIASDGSGKEYQALITDRSKAEIISVSQRSQTGKKIHLFISMIKEPRFEIALEKCTEIGVSSFTPIISEYSVIKELGANKEKRFMTIIEQALRQSCTPMLPTLNPVQTFKDATESVKNSSIPSLLGSFSPQSTLWQNFDRRRCEEFNIFIGPEGGFSAKENKCAIDAGMNPISLGENILRAETAAIVFSSLVKFS